MTQFDKLTQTSFGHLEVSKEVNDMKIDLSYEGPAINIKIRGDEMVILDADMLLALPLNFWPRFV